MSRWARFAAFAAPRVARGAFAPKGFTHCLCCSPGHPPHADVAAEVFGTSLASGRIFFDRIPEIADEAPLPLCRMCTSFSLGLGHAFEAAKHREARARQEFCPCVGFVAAFLLMGWGPLSELACAGFVMGVSLEAPELCASCQRWQGEFNRGAFS